MLFGYLNWYPPTTLSFFPFSFFFYSMADGIGDRVIFIYLVVVMSFSDEILLPIRE